MKTKVKYIIPTVVFGLAVCSLADEATLPSGTQSSQEQDQIELFSQHAQRFHAFGLVESFTWKEFDDSGAKLLEENGLLFGVGIKGELPVGEQAEFDFLATLYGGNIDYDGHTMGGVPVKATTGYVGMRTEWMISYLVDVGPDDGGELILKPGAGLGLRAWKRSLDNKGSFLGENIGSMGYIENWMTMYAKVGIGAELKFSTDCDLSTSLEARLPLFNRNVADMSDHGGPSDITIEPGRSVSLYWETGLRYKNFSGALYLETLEFSRSAPDSKYGMFLQPRSSAFIAGVRAGMTF